MTYLLSSLGVASVVKPENNSLRRNENGVSDKARILEFFPPSKCGSLRKRAGSFVKRLGAGSALEAASIDIQHDPATMHRQIARHLLPSSEPYQVVRLAMLALDERLFGFGADVIVAIVLFQRNFLSFDVFIEALR